MGVQMCSQLRRRRERGVAGDLFFHWLSSEYWPDIIKNLRRPHELSIPFTGNTGQIVLRSVTVQRTAHKPSPTANLSTCVTRVSGDSVDITATRVRKTENFAGFTGFYREVHAGSPLAHPRLRFASLS
uniref:Uncharacterized protein n=1 Tax=Klebsiella pneumoniae TaxID=573 RepID=A0A2P1BNZ5_KLEPN|nr:hypothetical protein [Klebsiella pneumoniae]